ncbi:MAG TPA: serine/threonine-protein kinase, partial [Gaiellaceae bacterium]|nr:serine/threonine-protein kinase [Gaiellaceae bacterium]
AYAFKRDSRHVYIAYEFVPGRTLRETMRAGELRDGAAIEACAQVCEALAHAHAAGILHRDVKPSNVLLADQGAGGARSSGRVSSVSPATLPASERVSARLLDFGLARMAEAETLTEQGDVPGTLAYISPERLAGERSTAAADVWAVGVMLWEALAGRHPFWQGSMLDTARAIERGAPPLAELRPDLPKQVLQLVDRALSLDPARRPAASELGHALRGAAAARRGRRSRSVRVSVPREPDQLAAAALAAAFAGGTAALLPFFPHGWALGLALACGALALVRERLGLALALAVPVLPLGNVSLGLAVLYGALAVAWFLLCRREPRSGLLFVLGPLLAPFAALGLFPLATVGVRGPGRRAALGAWAVLVAALTAGVRHAHLPLTGAAAPLGLGVAGANDPFDVAGSLVRAAVAQHALLVEAAAFAIVSLALPHARARGRWGAAGLGALMLVLTLLPAPSAAALPLAAAAWILAAFAALRPLS